MFESPSLEQLKTTYRNLAYVHQTLMRSQFYVEDFKAADEAVRFITDLANKVGLDLQAMETPKAEEASSTETSEAVEATDEQN